MSVDVAAGRVVVYTDVGCARSTVAPQRFYDARSRLGLDGRVHAEHRLFLLEDVNRSPVPELTVDVEIPVVGVIAPEIGFTRWQGEPSTWPVTSAPADEAVHAARDRSEAAAEHLDMALQLTRRRTTTCSWGPARRPGKSEEGTDRHGNV